VNDSRFLSELGVMDYSLLVGLSEGKGHLVIGIIDYLRQYTWDKQLETYVKSSGVLGGGSKQPTIISPKLYKERFLRAMMQYLVTVRQTDPPELYRSRQCARAHGVHVGCVQLLRSAPRQAVV